MKDMRALARLFLVFVGAAVVLLQTANGGSARPAGGSPVALVTAESSNEVLAVSLPAGKVLRRVHIVNPQAIAAQPSGPAVVVSPSGTVTLLAYHSLRPLRVFRSLRSPQIAAITPDGKWVYVTDAATGKLCVINLAERKIVDTVFVGAGAHHLAISPDGARTWVALSEQATTIVTLNTSNPAAPQVVSRFRPPVAAHDLAFAPDGQTVWVTSAAAPYVSVLSAHSARLIARVSAGKAPQHIAFIPYGKPRAFISSGYGSTIEEVNAGTRRIIARAELPYGSFNLATAGDIVVTASLLDGEISEFNGATLARWMTRKLAPATRSVAISVWP
jgi:DNA-binding beta-propeller fold protein YncE